MRQFTRKQIRAVLLESVATGNKKTSPFLHGTKDLQCLKNLLLERKGMYTHWIVRWPLTAEEGVIDLSDAAAQSQWLCEEGGDTDLMWEHLKTCRSYAGKDKEVVVMSRPKWEKVSWWDVSTETWQPLGDDVFKAERLIRGDSSAAGSQSLPIWSGPCRTTYCAIGPGHPPPEAPMPARRVPGADPETEEALS